MFECFIHFFVCVCVNALKTLNLRLVVSSGEPLLVATANKFFQTFPTCRLLNIYGATETSADCLWKEGFTCLLVLLLLCKQLQSTTTTIIRTTERLQLSFASSEATVSVARAKRCNLFAGESDVSKMCFIDRTPKGVKPGS